MISQKDEIKIAESLGIEVRFDEATRDINAIIGTEEQLEEFHRLCGVLKEQFEHEANLIRENQ